MQGYTAVYGLAVLAIPFETALLESVPAVVHVVSYTGLIRDS